MKINYYLKMNTNSDTAFNILARWLLICRLSGEGNCYLLCDNPGIIEAINEQYAYLLDHFQIITSDREHGLSKYLGDKVFSDRWKAAGYAHLTTFLHAKETGCDAFWNIDADDLFLALSPEKSSVLLRSVENTAREKNIHALSLDMHFSRREGFQWSFGLTYTDNTIDWPGVIAEHVDEYASMRGAIGRISSLDWYFTFLRTYANECRLESFYAENLHYIHYGPDFFRLQLSCGLYYFTEGKLIIPVTRDVFQVHSIGELPIHPDVVPVVMEGESISREESIEELQKFAGLEIFVEKSITNIEEPLCRLLEPYLNDESVRVMQRSKKMAGDVIKQENNRLVIRTLQDSPDVVYVLCPYGVGDTLYTLALSHAWAERIFPGKKLCFIVKDGHAVLCKWFSGEAAVVESSALNEGLNYYCVTNGITRLDNFLYAHFEKSEDFRLLPAYAEYPEKNMLARYKGLVFDLPADTALGIPQIPKMTVEEAERLGVNKRSVILMPYARSCENLLPVFWEALAKGLAALGYNVYTNIAPGEEPVAGTKPLSEDLEKTAGLCENALAVISIRSGICDVLAFTETILFVINTSQYHLNEWNLSHATSRDGIVNLLCDSPEKLSETVKAILGFFQDAMDGS